jgi:hypothetical protein
MYRKNAVAGKKIFVGSIIAMLLIAGFLGVVNRPFVGKVSAASDQPMKIVESNNYNDQTTHFQQIFTVSWITDGDYTGTVIVGNVSGFDPTWEGATNNDDRGGATIDDVHHCAVLNTGSGGIPYKIINMTTYYYYIESPIGKIWGEDPASPGEAKLRSAGGTAFVFQTATDLVGAVAPPIRGYVQYGPASEYRNDELVYITANKSGNPSDKPGWPLSAITSFGGPSTKNGYYQGFPKYFQKDDYSGVWVIGAGDLVQSDGEGSADGTGSVNKTWSGPPLDMPDIVLWPPNGPPVANFTVDSTNKPCGEPAVWDTVYFNSTTTDDYTSRNDLLYNWSFGDGTYAEGNGTNGFDNVTHVYYTSGIYTVTLNVTDDGSPALSDETSQDVKIWPNRVSTTPLDVRETNLKNVACKISWHTCINTTGYVIWGDTPGDLGNTSTDVRGDTGYTDDTHACDVTGLIHHTTYYYKVISDGKTYDDFGAAFSFTTGKTISTTPWGNMEGYVYKSDGITPAEGVIVYMTLRLDADGTTSLPEAKLTSSAGYYKYDRGNFRTQDGELQFDYLPGTDYCDKVAEGATEGTAGQTVVLTSKDSGTPQMDPNMILSGTPPDTTKPTSTASSPSVIGAATWNVDYTAEDGCASGLDYVKLY